MSSIKRRYEKFVKLARLSSNVINEFGFGYFLKAAKWQLKKEGLSVLKPEYESDKSEYSEPQAYRIWMQEHAITEDTILAIKQEMDVFTKKPKISVMISILQPDVAFLKNTLDSLFGQMYENFEIRLVFSPAITGAVTEVSNQTSDQRLVKSESVSQSLNAAMSAVSGDFVIFI